MPSDIQATGLILCQDIQVDNAHRQSIIGTLREINATSFPLTIPRLAVYASFEGTTLGSGVVVTFTKADDSAALQICPQIVDNPFVRGTASIEAYFRDLQIEGAGIYRVRVYNDEGQQLISRKLAIELRSVEEMQKAFPNSTLVSPSAMAPIGNLLNERELNGILNQWPMAVDLYNEVKAFFGDKLRVLLHRLTEDGGHSLTVTPQFSMLDSVVIDISEHAGNLAAVLIWQLLLVRLLKKGFPIISSVRSDGEWNPSQRGRAASLCSGLYDSILHAVVAREAEKIGVQYKDVFIGPSSVDVEAQCRGVTEFLNSGVPERAARGVWNELYVQTLIQESLWKTTGRAFELRKRGRRIIPALEVDAIKIADWLSAQDFAISEKFAQAFKKLLYDVGLPQVKLSRFIAAELGIELAPLLP